MLPLSYVRFVNMQRSPFVENRIEEETKALARVHPTLRTCNVTVTAPSAHHHKGLYTAHIQLRTAGHDIAVTHAAAEDDAHRDVYVAIRDAFEAARRTLASRKSGHQAQPA